MIATILRIADSELIMSNELIIRSLVAQARHYATEETSYFDSWSNATVNEIKFDFIVFENELIRLLKDKSPNRISINDPKVGD